MGEMFMFTFVWQVYPLVCQDVTDLLLLSRLDKLTYNLIWRVFPYNCHLELKKFLLFFQFHNWMGVFINLTIFRNGV
jgi:hypothetical protein